MKIKGAKFCGKFGKGGSRVSSLCRLAQPALVSVRQKPSHISRISFFSICVFSSFFFTQIFFDWSTPKMTKHFRVTLGLGSVKVTQRHPIAIWLINTPRLCIFFILGRTSKKPSCGMVILRSNFSSLPFPNISNLKSVFFEEQSTRWTFSHGRYISR